MKVFQRLLASLGLAPELADAVVDWIDADDSDLSGTGGAEDRVLPFARRSPIAPPIAPMVQVEELYRVRGFDAATVAKLRPYVTALARDPHGPINVNTASDVAARRRSCPAWPKDKIEALVAVRTTQPLQDRDADHRRLDAQGLPDAPRTIDVKSAYFSVRVRVAQDDVQLATDALLVRGPGHGARSCGAGRVY